MLTPRGRATDAGRRRCCRAAATTASRDEWGATPLRRRRAPRTRSLGRARQQHHRPCRRRSRDVGTSTARGPPNRHHTAHRARVSMLVDHGGQGGSGGLDRRRSRRSRVLASRSTTEARVELRHALAQRPARRQATATRPRQRVRPFCHHHPIERSGHVRAFTPERQRRRRRDTSPRRSEVPLLRSSRAPVVA